MLGSMFDGDEDMQMPLDIFAEGTPATSGPTTASGVTATRSYLPSVADPRPPCGFVGLANQGATCYLNSLLQCLYMTPEFRNGLYALTLDELEIDAAAPRDPVPVADRATRSTAALQSAKKETTSAITPQQKATATTVVSTAEAAASATVPENDEPMDEAMVLVEALFDDVEGPKPTAKKDTAPTATAPSQEKVTTAGSPKATATAEPEPVMVSAPRPQAQTAPTETIQCAPPLSERRGRLVPFELQRLFAFLQFADLSYVSTRALTSSFGWEQSQAGQQQDVQELNRLLFEEIEAALSGTKEEALISSIYRETKGRDEFFQDVQVGVRGHETLEQSLGAFVAFEELKGDNQYFCENCGHKVDARKGVLFAHLPRVLVFSLSRFEYDWKEDKRVKISSEFAFPNTLDMAPFLVSETAGASAVFDLCFVVIHRGGAYGGHYHCLIKAPEDGERPAMWLDFNDGSVSEVPESAVAKTFHGKSDCAYMIGYRKREPSASDLLPELADLPPAEIMEEVMENDRRLAAERAERDRIVHEIHVVLCSQALVTLTNGTTLHYADGCSRSEDGPARKTLVVDTRKGFGQFVVEAASLFGVPRESVVLSVLSDEVGDRNILVSKSIVAGDVPADASIETAGLSGSAVVLVWDGKSINGQPWGPEMSPVTLRVKISTMAGVDTHVEARLDEPLSTVVSTVESVSGIPRSQMQFELSGHALDLSSRLSELGLRHLSTVYVRRCPPPTTDVEHFVSQASAASVVTAPAADLITVYATVNVRDEAIPSIAVNLSAKCSVSELKSMILSQVENPPAEHTVDLFRSLSGSGVGKRFDDPTASLEKAGVSDSQRVILLKADPDSAPAVVPDGVSAGSNSITVTFIFKTEDGPVSHKMSVSKFSSVSECKVAVAALLGLNPMETRLRKLDMFDMPGEFLNDEEREIQRHHIRDGDTIVVEKGKCPPPGSVAFTVLLLEAAASDSVDCASNSKISALGSCSPLLYVGAGNGMSLPPNCAQLDDVAIAGTSTLYELKAAVLSVLPTSCTIDRVRLWHRSRLLRKEDATLKQLHIVEDPTIYAQVLADTDPVAMSPPTSLLLFFHKRNVTQDIFEPAESFVVDSQQSVFDLYDAVAKVSGIPVEYLRVVRYHPSAANWIPLDRSSGIRSQPKLPKKQPNPTEASATTAEETVATAASAKPQKQQQPRKAPQSSVVALSQKPFSLKDGDTLSAADLRELPEAANERYIFLDWPPLLKLSTGCGMGLHDLVGGESRPRRPEPQLVINGYARRMHMLQKQQTPSPPQQQH